MHSQQWFLTIIYYVISLSRDCAGTKLSTVCARGVFYEKEIYEARGLAPRPGFVSKHCVVTRVKMQAGQDIIIIIIIIIIMQKQCYNFKDFS